MPALRGRPDAGDIRGMEPFDRAMTHSLDDHFGSVTVVEAADRAHRRPAVAAGTGFERNG